MICMIIIIMIRCELGYHIVFPFSKHSSRILSIANLFNQIRSFNIITSYIYDKECYILS